MMRVSVIYPMFFFFFSIIFFKIYCVAPYLMFSFLLLTLLALTRYVTVALLFYANAPCTNSLVSSSIPTMPISVYVLLTGERGPQIWPYSLPTVLP